MVPVPGGRCPANRPSLSSVAPRTTAAITRPRRRASGAGAAACGCRLGRCCQRHAGNAPDVRIGAFGAVVQAIDQGPRTSGQGVGCGSYAVACGFRRNGAPRPEVLEQSVREFWSGAAGVGSERQRRFGCRSPPSGMCDRGVCQGGPGVRGSVGGAEPKLRGRCRGQGGAVVSLLLGAGLRRDSPRSSMRCAVCRIRSQMASARVGSPRLSCQARDRELAGQDGRAALVAVLDDLQQVRGLGGGQRAGVPRSSRTSTSTRAQLAISCAARAVGVGEAQVVEQAGQPAVERAVAAADRGVGQRAGQVGLARSRSPR